MAAARMTPLQGRVLSSLGSSLVVGASQKSGSTASLALERRRVVEPARHVSTCSRFMRFFSTLPVAQGVLAANARKEDKSLRCMSTATEKEPTRSDIVERIKHDHEELEEFYANHKKAHKSGNDTEAYKWFNQFVWEISRHAVSEELVLTSCSPLKALRARHSPMSHAPSTSQLKSCWRSFRIPDPNVFDQKMDKMMAELREHIKKENREDLPYLQEHVSPSDLESAGSTFQLGKKLAPSRPHAGVPNKPAALEAALGFC